MPAAEDGGAAWGETLVVPLALSPSSPLPHIKLTLRDAAAGGGAGAAVAVADVPLGDDPAAPLAAIELLPLPPHTTTFTLHARAAFLPALDDADAVDTATLGGARALRVGGPRGAWVRLPPPSLGRAAAAPVGDADRRRRSGVAPVAPPADAVGVRLPGGDGVALETVDPGDGTIVETVRSLCRVENCTPFPIAVALEPAPADAASAATDTGAPTATDAVFEHERYVPLRGWGARGFLLIGERRRYAADARGRGSTWHFPSPAPPPGWTWDGPWDVERGAGTDADGWSYGPDFASMPHPPPRGAGARGPVDFVRRRRLVRRRVRVTEVDGEGSATRAPTPPAERTLLGVALPGGCVSLPHGWRSRGAQVGLRFVDADDAGDADSDVGWAVGAGGEGRATLPLAAVDDGVTRLVCAPAPRALTGSTAAWLSLAVEGDPLPTPGARRGRALVDWRIRVCPPLTLVLELPMAAAFTVWEEGAGGATRAAASSRAPPCARVPILTADPRRALGLTLHPDGYEWASLAPAPLADGVAADDAGVGAPPPLPRCVRVRRAGGGDPVDLRVDRDVDADAWALDDDPDVGGAAAAGAPLVVRVAPVAILRNDGPLPVVAALVPGRPLAAPARSSAAADSEDGATAPPPVLTVDVGGGPGGARPPPPTAPRRRVAVGGVELLSLPEGTDRNSTGPQPPPSLQLLLGDSDQWTPPLSLAASPGGAAAAADGGGGAPPAALVTARVPAWGVVADVALHVDDAGAAAATTDAAAAAALEGVLCVTLAPRWRAVNATGVPLQLAAAHATGAGPDAAADVVDLPPGGPPAPLVWPAGGAARRAVCVRRPGGPWSPPLDVGAPTDGAAVAGLPCVPAGAKAVSAASASRGAAALPLRQAAAARVAAAPPAPLLPAALAAALAADVTPPSSLPHATVLAAGVPLPATPLRYAVTAPAGGCLEVALLAAAGGPGAALANASPDAPLAWRATSDAPWCPLPPLTAVAVLPPTAGGAVVCVSDALAAAGGDRTSTAAATAHYALAAAGGRPAAAAARARLPPLRTVTGASLSVASDERRPALADAAGRPAPLAPGDAAAAAVGRGTPLDVLRVIPAPREGPSLPPPPADAAAGTPITITADAGGLELSLVDHRPEEVAALRARGARVAYSARLGPGGAFERLAIDVGGVSVDDMAAAPRFPVLVAADAPDEPADTADPPPPLLHIVAAGRRAAVGGGSYFALLGAWVGAPLRLAVGEAFVWRAADAASRLASAAAAAAVRSGGSTPATHATTDPPVRAALVALGPASAAVSFRSDRAARPRWARRLGRAAWILDVASFDNAPVRLAGFQLTDVATRASSFWAGGAARVKAQVAGAWFALVGALGVLSGASGVLGALSDSVAGLASDDAYAADRAASRSGRAISGVGAGLAEGGGALGRAVLRGVTGVVARPLEGAMRGGVAGFVRGAAAGLVGVVAQPVSGGLDLLSSTLEGVDAAASAVAASVGGRRGAARARLPRVARTPRVGLRPLGGPNAGAARSGELGQELMRRVAASVAAGDRGAPGAPLFLPGASPTPAAAGADAPAGSAAAAAGDGPAYDAHHVLPDDRCLLLTDRGVALIAAVGLACAQRAAEGGAPTDPPPDPALRWAVAWSDVLAAEARRSSAATAGGAAAAAVAAADRVALHRVGGGTTTTDTLPLALGIRCAPSWRQADAVAADVERAAAAARGDAGRADAARWEAAAAAAERGATDASLPAELPCVDWALVWTSDGDVVGAAAGGELISLWRPVAPHGYAPGGDVVVAGTEPPAAPVTVYRLHGDGGGGAGDEEDGARRGPPPPTAPPTGFRLAWRHDGAKPLALWQPIPKPGYVALGACARGATAPPRTARARARALARPTRASIACVRADLAVPAMLYDAPAWSADPAAAVRAAGGVAFHPYDPAGFAVALWQVDAPAGGFAIGRSSTVPPEGVAWRVVLSGGG